jgi:hypothetical protein
MRMIAVWYAREDSNLWPLAPEASALSAELRAQIYWRQLYLSSRIGISIEVGNQISGGLKWQSPPRSGYYW